MARKQRKAFGVIIADRPMMRVAAERVGLRKAYTAGVFAALWACCEKSLGRPPETIEEYAEWACLSRSQGFRQQQIFREAWPEFPTPSELVEHLRVSIDVDDRDLTVAEFLGAHFA